MLFLVIKSQHISDCLIYCFINSWFFEFFILYISHISGTNVPSAQYDRPTASR